MIIIIIFNMFNISDIENATDIMNTVLYLSFGPVLILYFCYSCKKVIIIFENE